MAKKGTKAAGGEMFEFLVLAEKMKTVRRDLLKSDGEFESDADHSWMMGLLAILFEPKLKNRVNMERVLKLIIVHDLAEAEAGDVPLHKQIGNEAVKAAKERAEREAITRMCWTLPGRMGEEVMGLWEEYERRETMEARFVKAIDKIEAQLQGLMYKDISYWNNYGDGVYFDVVLNNRKREFWEHEEELVAFGEEIKVRMREKMVEAGVEFEGL